MISEAAGPRNRLGGVFSAFLRVSLRSVSPPLRRGGRAGVHSPGSPRSRIVRIGNRAAPHRHNLVIGPQKADIAFAFFIAIKTPITLETIPQRCLRQSLQQIDSQPRALRPIDETLEPAFDIVGSGVEPEDDAGRNLQAVI